MCTGVSCYQAYLGVTDVLCCVSVAKPPPDLTFRDHPVGVSIVSSNALQMTRLIVVTE